MTKVGTEGWSANERTPPFIKPASKNGIIYYWRVIWKILFGKNDVKHTFLEVKDSHNLQATPLTDWCYLKSCDLNFAEYIFNNPKYRKTLQKSLSPICEEKLAFYRPSGPNKKKIWITNEMLKWYNSSPMWRSLTTQPTVSDCIALFWNWDIVLTNYHGGTDYSTVPDTTPYSARASPLVPQTRLLNSSTMSSRWNLYSIFRNLI